MNRKLALALTTLILAGTALPAFAEDAPHGGPRMDGPRKDRGAKMFEEADANKDGELTKGEMLQNHEKRIDKMFGELDADKSGKLSKDELAKGREKMRERWKAMKDHKDGPDAGPEGPGGEDGTPPAPPEDGEKPE